MTDSAASVSGGIVSFVGLPHVSPLLDKAGILLGHVTGLFFTGAAFSPVCSRRNLNTRYGPFTVMSLELQAVGNAGKSLSGLHFLKHFVSC